MDHRVGIIGCGCIFPVHVAALQAIEGISLTSVCDLREDRLSVAADRTGARPFSDYQALIQSGLADTVHICTPHHLHTQMAVYAMEHGVDVLCEKPMSITLAEARHMDETARRTGQRLGIIYQNRFNAGAVLVKQALEAGKLGRVLGAVCRLSWNRNEEYYQRDAWRGRWDTEGGGVVINQAVHTLDLLRWLMEDRPVRVEARLAHFGETSMEVEDTAMGRIVFAGGAAANFYFTTTGVLDSDVELTLHCEKGEAMLNGGDGCYRLDGGEEIRAEEPAALLPAPPDGKPVYGAGHLRQFRAFYGDPAFADDSRREALETQALLCGIYQSAREGRPVEL